MDFNDEVARGGAEFCLEDCGGFGRERCWVEQGRMRAGRGAVGGTGFRGGALGGSAFGSRGLGVHEKARKQDNNRRNCFHEDDYTKRRPGVGTEK